MDAAVNKAASYMRRQGEESRKRLADGIGFVYELLSTSGGGRMARTRDHKPFLNEDWFLLTIGGGVRSSPQWAETVGVVAPANAAAPLQSERVEAMPATGNRKNPCSHMSSHPSLYETVLSLICAPAGKAASVTGRRR
jgi:hypothetical protein